MNFIRPEVREILWQWREAIVGGFAVALGLWLALEGLGFVAIFGGVVMLGGVGILIAGLQRARFRRGHGGPGVVQVTEGQVTYFGPMTGGATAIASIYEVTLVPAPPHGAFWIIKSPGVEPLRIPTNAQGSEALFDVFSSLPGLQPETMLRALEDLGNDPQLVWTRRLLH